MSQITGQQLKQSMIDAGVLFVIKGTCPLCQTPILYYRKGEHIFIDTECMCQDKELQPCTWDEVAEWINDHDEVVRSYIALRFGIRS